MVRDRTMLERIAVLEERQDNLKEAIDDVSVKLDRLLDDGNQRGRTMSDMQAAVTALQGGVIGLKQDTSIIRNGMVIARVGRRISTFAVWALPVGAGLFVWLGERWELLIGFIRGSAR